MRTLRLTSPEMRGEDIRDLQKVLNERLEHYKSHGRVSENGIYDRGTAHAVAIVAVFLGLRHYDGIPAVTRLIEHPHLRNPEEIHTEHERAKARLEADHVATKKDGTGEAIQGLPRIPLIAEHFVGTHEDPPNSNWGVPYPAGWEKAFGFDSGVSWCGCFSGSMVNLAGGHVDSRVAFCPYIEADARSKTNGFDLWVPDHQDAGIGWLALFNWSGGSEPEHVEIVKEITPSGLVCVGGNTSGTDPAWGGMVGIEQRPFSLVVGYARPRL